MAGRLVLSDDVQGKVVAAIRSVQQNVQWKPSKDQEHLETRKRYGHLNAGDTIEDYNEIIGTLVNSEDAKLYIYVWQEEKIYPVIVSTFEQRIWLVMVNLSGILETAFPPTDSDQYLSDQRFHLQGALREFLK